MRVMIVDDERLARDEMRRLLRSHSDVEIAGEARDADEAETLMASVGPDVLFLDVQMPGCSGFELLERLDEIPLVVFTTAYDRFALKAFEVSALDYLLKPVHPDRLSAALERVRKQLAAPAKNRPASLAQVFVKDGDRCWLVQIEDIKLLESEGNYTRVYFGNERPLILRSLAALETKLDPAVFFRASRQHIINLGAVERAETAVDGGLVVMVQGGLEVRMSRRQSQKLRETMSL